MRVATTPGPGRAATFLLLRPEQRARGAGAGSRDRPCRAATGAERGVEMPREDRRKGPPRSRCGMKLAGGGRGLPGHGL